MEKYWAAKILPGIWEIFLHKSDWNYNTFIFSYRLAFISCFSFHRNRKQKAGFQQVGGLVMENISVFCLQESSCMSFLFMLQFHGGAHSLAPIKWIWNKKDSLLYVISFWTPRIWLHLPKKSLMENFIFSAVTCANYLSLNLIYLLLNLYLFIFFSCFFFLILHR